VLAGMLMALPKREAMSAAFMLSRP
jgi:hypothetical protein